MAVQNNSNIKDNSNANLSNGQVATESNSEINRFDEIQNKLEIAYRLGKINGDDYYNMMNQTNKVKNAKSDAQIQYNDFIGSLNDKDKSTYETYSRLENGDFTDQDKYYSFRHNSAKDILYTDAQAVAHKIKGRPVTDLYNRFYDGMDERKIAVGTDFYDMICTKMSTSGTSFNELGIKVNKSDKEFIIPRDKKSFAKFAEIYTDAYNAYATTGLLTNTANKFSLGNRGYLHNNLVSFGEFVNDTRQKYNNILDSNSNTSITVNLESIFSNDVSTEKIYQDYYKGKLEREDLNKVLQRNKDNTLMAVSANLTQYEVFGNIEGILNTDPSKGLTDRYSILSRIDKSGEDGRGMVQEHIATILGDKSGDEKVKQLSISFANPDGLGYGSVIHVPAWTEADVKRAGGTQHGAYSIFVKQLMPGPEAEAYANSPLNKAKSNLGVWNAIGKANQTHSVDLGMSGFDGKISAKGNNNFSYIINGIEYNANKQELVNIMAASEQFRNCCQMRYDLGKLIKMAKTPEEQQAYIQQLQKFDDNVHNWLYTAGDDSSQSIVNNLNSVTGENPANIANSLYKSYLNYSK